LAIKRPLACSGTEIGRKKILAGFHVERSKDKAMLPDSTVSGGFWEERRNAKVTETIKTHVEWTVSGCGHVEKKIPKDGDKSPPPFLSFLSGRRGSEEEVKKRCAEQRHLGVASCLFFAAAI
jgi:hypothetical protein